MKTEDATFAALFCAKHNIPREAYAKELFNRALYRRTHLVKWLLPLLSRNHFVADYDLVYAVERLRRRRDFILEAHRFNEHPANCGWLRRTLRLRISTGRLKALIRETLPRQAGGSGAPFEVEDGGQERRSRIVA